MVNTSNSALLNITNWSGWMWYGWTALEAIGTIVAFIVALWAIFQNRKHFNKHIETEQEPFVLATDPMKLKKERKNIANKNSNNYVEQYEFKIKNVGRGPALKITGGTERNKDNNPFFADEFPHSYGLSSAEFETTRIDKFRIEEMLTKDTGEEQRHFFYLFYYDQMGNKYITTVIIKKRIADAKKDTPEFYVVMENNREKVKGDTLIYRHQR